MLFHSAYKRLKSSLFLFSVVTLLLLTLPGGVEASKEQEKREPASADIIEGQPSTELTLNGIVRSISSLESEIVAKKKELRARAAKDDKLKVIEEISTLKKKLLAFERDYEEVATGVDLEIFDSAKDQDFKWAAEIQELLGPIIQELKSMTARPRSIEKLRSEVLYYKERLPFAAHAVNNIDSLISQTEEKNLKRRLKSLKKKWETNSKNLANQLAASEYKLNEKLNEKKSFLESLGNFMKIFFKNRGKNLFLALGGFVLVFTLLRLIYKLYERFKPSLKDSKRAYYTRIADLSYQIFTVLAAMSAMLSVLYLSGDWVLLGVVLILLFGLLWSARHGVSLFWEQCKLLLNVGSVREGERVIFRGLPWKVQSLNLYTTLINPNLKGGVLRLPVRELITLHSRPFGVEEPWFPSKKNDWVILSDGTLGKVALQTPEIVQLLLLGSSHKTYITEEFLKYCPENISKGFRLKVSFGVDYKHQADIISVIPDKLRQAVIEGFGQIGYEEQIVDLTVIFKEAGPSSLDLEVIADFPGIYAKDYNMLQRMIQQSAVNACNRYGWVIPFTQIMLHSAEEVK